MAVPVQTSPAFRPGVGHALFADPYLRNPDHTNHDVSRDGRSFYLARRGARNASIVVVLNWFEELQARMSEK